MRTIDTMLEKGIVDERAQSVKCPSCNAAGLYDPVKDEFITELHHGVEGTPCLYVKGCRDMGIDPYSKESAKKAMESGLFVVEYLFDQPYKEETN